MEHMTHGGHIVARTLMAAGLGFACALGAAGLSGCAANQTVSVCDNVVIAQDVAGHYVCSYTDGSPVQGAYYASNGQVFLADGAGVLEDSGWLTSADYGQGLQRYYVSEKTHSCVTGFSDEGGLHYTTVTGCVARGAFTVNGLTYFAGEDGLVKTNQWITTDTFTEGEEHQYWAGEDGALVRTPGFATLDNSTYYLTETGYPLVGSLVTENGVIVTTADGRVAENYVARGWMSSSLFDEEERRYYFKEVDGHVYAQVGLFEAEYKDKAGWFYADPATGHVLTGKIPTENGVLLTDVNGFLAGSDLGVGWYEGTAFDAEPQRYYFQEIDGHLYATTGWFTADGNAYMGSETQGYVLVSTVIEYQGTYYAADETGVLSYTDDPFGPNDATLAINTWKNNPFYLNAMIDLAREVGSSTDYFIMADWTRCRFVVLQKVKDEQGAYVYQDGLLKWVVVKTWNGNFGQKSYAGTHVVVHKMLGNCIANSDVLSDGSENPSAWSTCYIEAWADGARKEYLWQDPATGLYHDCASVHGTGQTTTGYDQEGCLGLQRENAKWVYDTIPTGTTVHIFE